MEGSLSLVIFTLLGQASAGMVLLLGLSAYVMYNDIARLIT